MKENKRKQFLVVGLGLFGSSVALTLKEMDYDVLCIDIDENVVQDYSNSFTYIVCGDAADERVLRSLSVGDIDVAVVAIGNAERSMMCTMLLKELGVPVVVAKALTELHGAMLAKLGADDVIYPEKDMGKRVAHNLVSASVMDYIELSREISLMNLQLPKHLVGKNLIDADLRRQYDVNVVAIKRNGETIVNPKAQEVFQRDDEIIIIGTHAGVKRMGVEF
ncbi:MAG: TrkA family potassium uptake protein [Phascolarctobacterium sp.]|nr:TrkA family potassium uptake protein [Acidaminococcaceae bacterium]MBQ7884094.1 TrkA family potassium uptake protein [Phascolarctobacterium sp.]